MTRHPVEEYDDEVVDVVDEDGDGEDEEPEETENVGEDADDEVIEVEDEEVEDGPFTEYVEEEEEQEEPEPFLLQDGEEENWIFPTPFDYTIHQRRLQTIKPNYQLHRRDPVPADTFTLTPTSEPNRIASAQPLITGPLISAGVAVTAVIIGLAALAINHQRNKTPSRTSKNPLSRTSSRLESAPTNFGNGLPGHQGAVVPYPKSSSAFINGMPVFMEKVTLSPKVSSRASMSSGSGSPGTVTRKASAVGSIGGVGKTGNRISVSPVRKEQVKEEEDVDDESGSESEEEKEKRIVEENDGELRKSPVLDKDFKYEAKILLDALLQLKDEKTDAVKFIYKKTPQNIAEISKCVAAICGNSLEEELHSCSSGDVRKILVGLITQPFDYDAICLEEAMKGIGCDEDALIEILVGRSNFEVEGIKAAYKARYGKDLEKVVSSEVHGHIRKLFRILLQAQRDEGNISSNIEEDIEALYNAGVGRQGTDETTFISILTARSDSHLRKMFTAYKLKYKDSMEEVVKKEFRGDLEKALLGIVRKIENRPRHVSALIEKSMKGIGHNHSKLIRLIVRHRNPDLMRQIKMEYLVENDKPLYDRIKEETTGLYQKCLLELVGQ